MVRETKCFLHEPACHQLLLYTHGVVWNSQSCCEGSSETTTTIALLKACTSVSPKAITCVRLVEYETGPGLLNYLES